MFSLMSSVCIGDITAVKPDEFIAQAIGHAMLFFI
jgi:hypothetical protein